MRGVMPSSRSCRETGFDSRLSQMDRGLAACPPRHDPDNLFQSMRPIERKNGPIWNHSPSRKAKLSFFTCWALPISCRGTSRKTRAVSGFTHSSRHDPLLGMTPQNGLFHDFVTTDHSANEDGSVPNLLGFWAKEARVPRSVLSETMPFLCLISCFIIQFSNCLRSCDTSGTYSFLPLVTLEVHF